MVKFDINNLNSLTTTSISARMLVFVFIIAVKGLPTILHNSYKIEIQHHHSIAFTTKNNANIEVSIVFTITNCDNILPATKCCTQQINTCKDSPKEVMEFPIAKMLY